MMKTTTMRQVIGAAFGNPFSFETFSGYSRHFFTALQQMNALAATLSSKLLRPQDLLRGCLNFSRLLNKQPPNISAHWLWDPQTIDTLSRRFERKLARYDRSLPVVQIGTHVYPIHVQRPFYCITDMTIKQALAARQFRIKHLADHEVAMAIQTQKHIFDTCEKVFVLCEWTKTSIVEDYDQPCDKVVVIGAGANMTVLEPAPEKYSSREILFVGYDWMRKGGPLLMEVFKLVRTRIPDAVLNVVGCVPAIHEPGVNIIGILRKSDAAEMEKLKALYQRANCFCLLPQFDPFPNVLLEAGITSTPVVSLSSGSRSDVVRNGVTGILVDRPNAAEVAEAMVYLLANPDVAQRMGAMARKCITDGFTWEIIAQKVLRNIFDEPPTPQPCHSQSAQHNFL